MRNDHIRTEAHTDFTRVVTGKSASKLHQEPEKVFGEASAVCIVFDDCAAVDSSHEERLSDILQAGKAQDLFDVLLWSGKLINL